MRLSCSEAVCACLRCLAVAPLCGSSLSPCACSAGQEQIMPYLHSQPSTSTSHLLAGHPNSSMDSPTSYMHSSADQEAKEGDDLLPSPSASPQQRPALQLPDGPQSSERGSKYAPRLRNAVRNLQAVKRTASGGRAGGYDWAFSGSGAESVQPHLDG